MIDGLMNESKRSISGQSASQQTNENPRFWDLEVFSQLGAHLVKVICAVRGLSDQHYADIWVTWAARSSVFLYSRAENRTFSNNSLVGDEMVIFEFRDLVTLNAELSLNLISS